MELISMTLENYRRFNEKTTINFARGDNNVTVIRSENGAGTTGILMSLIFGLFVTVRQIKTSWVALIFLEMEGLPTVLLPLLL